MTTKALISFVDSMRKLEGTTEWGKGTCDEIIQRLREHDELKDLIRQVAVPSQEIAQFLGYLINLE